MMTQKEMLEKAKQAKSPEELLLLAKENGIELSEKNAAVYFSRIHSESELSDTELANVSGGLLVAGRDSDADPHGSLC